MDRRIITGRCVTHGTAKGIALVCEGAIQGWAGIDDATGQIIEENHPLKGEFIKDRVLVLSGGKGSNGWSCHFHAARLNGIAPAAMLFPKMDSRTGVAAVVTEVPVVADFDTDIFTAIETGDYLVVNADNGTVEITKKENRHGW